MLAMSADNWCIIVYAETITDAKNNIFHTNIEIITSSKIHYDYLKILTDDLQSKGTFA